jgi:L-alanine-DL-glutamate epimerase-like enolase superfamily enzyme
MARIQRETGIPVMADESLCTLDDARALIEADAAKIWNVRLAKVGGFTGFLEMLMLAQQHNIRIHHGVLVGETAILTAAQRACAGLTDYAHVEYGFPQILLKQNPFKPIPDGLRGTARPLSPEAGLSIEPIPALLDAVTIERIALS